MNGDQPNVTTERVWRELSDRLRQFIRSRVTSAADVDDILQTVFLRIHENVDGLRRVQRLESWVFQITRNAVADHFRTNQHTSNEGVSPIAVGGPSETENVNEVAAGCLTTLIDHLPEDQKRAVSMYELEGVSQADIADRESISLSGAKSRIQRGRRKLEELLRECCQFQLDARGNVLELKGVNNNCGPDGRCGSGY